MVASNFITRVATTIATVPLVLGASFIAPEAKASSSWTSFVAQRICVHLRNGNSAYDASYAAGMDTVGTRHQQAFMRAANSMTQKQIGTLLMGRVMRICPSDLQSASAY